MLVWRLESEKQKFLNKVVNVCGKVVGESQEQLSQLYERRVVRKAGVIVDANSHVLAKHYELLPSGRRFRVPKSNTVNSISEQINPFKRQSCVCVCKLLDCLLCIFCIFNNCSLSFKIYNICYCVL